MRECHKRAYKEELCNQAKAREGLMEVFVAGTTIRYTTNFVEVNKNSIVIIFKN